MPKTGQMPGDSFWTHTHMAFHDLPNQNRWVFSPSDAPAGLPRGLELALDDATRLREEVRSDAGKKRSGDTTYPWSYLKLPLKLPEPSNYQLKNGFMAARNYLVDVGRGARFEKF